MNQLSEANLSDIRADMQRKRKLAITTYNDLLTQLDRAVNKGNSPVLLNAITGCEVSEIAGYIAKMTSIKKQIFSINSALLSLDFGNYGVCVKSGKYIPREWPVSLCDAGFEEVEALIE